jgi:hypothetical protein
MHRPPAVSHTVGRSSWHLYLIASLAVIALVCAAALAFSSTSPIFSWLAFAAVLCCTVVALTGWSRSSSGKLQWDGQHWLWSGFADIPVCQTLPILDFQGLLLLKVTSEMGDVAWLWLQGAMNDAHWLAMRRAVVASQNTQERQRAPLPEAGTGATP